VTAFVKELHFDAGKGALKSRDLTRRHQIKQHDWLYDYNDCALTGALSCFIERRRTVDSMQDDAMMTTKT